MLAKYLSAPVRKPDDPADSQETHISTSAKWKLIAGTVALLILALVFNALLSSSSLKKLYEESIVSEYRMIGKDLQRDIEGSLRSGASIREFFGMDGILEKTKERIVRDITKGSMISVSVALPDGSVRYSTDKKLSGATLPEQVRFNYETAEDQNKSSLQSHYAKYENTYITALPVRNREENWEGTVIIAFGEKQVRDIHDAVFDKNVRAILVIMISSAMLLALFNLMILSKATIQAFPKRKISIVIFLIIILSQLVFSGLNVNAFKNHYQQIHKERIK